MRDAAVDPGRHPGLAGLDVGEELLDVGDAAAVLVGLGVTSLSASPSALPAVAARVVSLDTATCRRAAEAALAAPDAAARASVRDVLG